MQWRRWERLLLVTFLIGRSSLLWRRFGEVVGFDTGGHLEMVTKLSWAMPNVPVRETFYSYHPPLGFLLARIPYALGFTPEHSVQIISWIASLTAFFFLRATLKHLRLLWTPSGIALLYVASSFPIQIALSTSINLDIILLAMSSALLWMSVHLLWTEHTFEDAMHLPRTLPLRFSFHDAKTRSHAVDCALYTAAAAITIACATFTKYSGVLLFSIPVWTALARPVGRGWWKHGSLAALSCTMAIGIAFPYYYGRYYAEEGKFFPVNVEWGAHDQTQAAIKERDKNPLKFFVELVKPSPVQASQGITVSDEGTNRLADMWRDYWIRSRASGSTTPKAISVGILYMHVAPWVLLMGLMVFFRQARRINAWMCLGWIVLAYGIVQFAALIHFIYEAPYAGWVPTKAMYVLPSVWSLAYLIANAFRDHRLLPSALRPYTIQMQNVAMVMVFSFVVVNHWIPVY